MQQHDMTKWMFRAVLVLGAIGFVTLYSVRHDWSKGWMPSMTPDYQPPSESTADTSASPAPVAAPAAAAPRSGELPAANWSIRSTASRSRAGNRARDQALHNEGSVLMPSEPDRRQAPSTIGSYQ